MSEEKRTPLYEEHVASGARMVPFGGYVMPLEYSGIISEHRAVRTHMGMFDLSHMGEFLVAGPAALAAVDAIVSNQVRNVETWQARYTPMCKEDGGIIDDLLVYNYPDHVMLVVNASNIDKDFRWIASHLPREVTLTDASDDIALVAVQGPDAVGFVQGLTSCNLQSLGYYHFRKGDVAGVPVTISRTGYTGEDGVELYADSSRAVELWRSLTEHGSEDGLLPIGLGARDTLRLEAGLALYGNDITEQTTPLEAGLGWTVKLEDRTFLGSKALARQKESGAKRRLVAFQILDRAIPRPHQPLYLNGSSIGEVTSGSFSPTFSKGIGMAYIARESSAPGTRIEVDIRGQKHPAEIVKKPMYQRPE